MSQPSNVSRAQLDLQITAFVEHWEQIVAYSNAAVLGSRVRGILLRVSDPGSEQEVLDAIQSYGGNAPPLYASAWRRFVAFMKISAPEIKLAELPSEKMKSGAPSNQIEELIEDFRDIKMATTSQQKAVLDASHVRALFHRGVDPTNAESVRAAIDQYSPVSQPQYLSAWRSFVVFARSRGLTYAEIPKQKRSHAEEIILPAWVEAPEVTQAIITVVRKARRYHDGLYRGLKRGILKSPEYLIENLRWSNLTRLRQNELHMRIDAHTYCAWNEPEVVAAMTILLQKGNPAQDLNLPLIPEQPGSTAALDAKILRKIASV